MNKLIGKPFFIRIAALVLSILILSLVLTSIIYTVASKEIFINYQLERLKEETDMLASLIPNEWMTRNVLDQFFDKVFQVESTILSSYVVVSDKLNVEVYSYVPSIQRSGVAINKQAMDAFYRRDLNAYVRKALTGQYINFTLGKTENPFGSDMIIIISPILSETGSVVAVLTICKFIDDYSIQLKSINKILLITMLLVAVLMLVPVYFLSKSMTKPLFKIKEVAIAMGEGNFSVRADENYPAEIGQLSVTMNHLASELSATIDRLTRETNVLQGVLNSMNEGILVIDKSYNPIIINPAIRTLFNCDSDCLDKNKIVPIDSIWKDFEHCINQNLEMKNTYDFEGIMILCVINPLLVNDMLIGAIGIFSDITKDVRLEQTRRDYVANVSHELKTPLTGVMGLLEPLKDGTVTDLEKVHRYYELMSDELHRLNRLINDLLVLSRLQSSNEAFAMEKVNLTDIINDKAERYRYLNKLKNIHIQFDIPKEPIFVFGNDDRIDQILTILMDNALKFKKEDTLEKSTVKIALIKQDNKYVISVQDNGRGITKEDIPYIFDRFYKSDKSRTGGGSGLGLSIAKETLMRMNEKIWAESDGKEMSIFRFTLTVYSEDNL